MDWNTLPEGVHNAFTMLFGDDHELVALHRLATASVTYVTAKEHQRLAFAGAMPKCFRAEMELREATVDFLTAISRVADTYGEGLTLDGFLEECLANRGDEDDDLAA